MATPLPPLRAAELDLDDIPYVEGMALSCMPPVAEYYEDPMWYDQGGRDPLVQREIFKLAAGEERTRRLKDIVSEYRLYGPMLYELAAEEGRVDIIRLLHELGANPNVERQNNGSDTYSTPSSDMEHESPSAARSSQEDTSTHDVENEAETEAEHEPKESTSAKTDVCGEEDEGNKSDEESSKGHDDADEGSLECAMSGSGGIDDAPLLTLHPPLTGAAFAGQLECVTVLLDELKVSIDEYDQNGPSIGYAAAAGHGDVVRFLLSRGAAIVTKPDTPDMLSLALKGGSLDAVNAILESEQWKSSEREVTVAHLPFAAHSRKQQLVELILSLCGLPQPTGNISDLTNVQSHRICDALLEATSKSALACLHPLLPYVTHQRADGSYAYFTGRDHFEIAVFNATEDAMFIDDNPDLFQLAWETIIHRPDTGSEDLMARTPFDAYGKPNITNHEALHRRLIVSAGHGRLETTKLICEHYGADVNHVSHKISSTPLSRAAGQGLYELQPRLDVARYLLEHTKVDISLADGEFANGSTPLALALSQKQPDMIRLLLEFGGPVDSINTKVCRRAEKSEPGQQVKICVACFYMLPRRDVRIMTKKSFKQAAKGEPIDHVMLEWERDDLLSMLARLKIRASDEELQRADPKGRPLAPPWEVEWAFE